MKYSLKDIIENTKDVYMTDSNLKTLMDFERVLDELDMYAYKNWKSGELVKGPVYEKYFVTCTFMWPYKLMPDPSGGERLLGYDCEVYYAKGHLTYPIKIKNPDDFEPGTKMPKMGKKKVWLVNIVMPKSLMQEISQGSIELEGENLDLEDLEQAYEDGSDDASENEAIETQNAQPQQQPPQQPQL